MNRLAVFTAALVALTGPLRAGDSGFIRVEEDAKAARLQTGITRYVKDGAAVDLIGAVHIGDKAYYEALNQRFTPYEVVLFEMIGGERANAVPAPAADAEPAPNPLGLIYGKIAETLALTGQVDHIDYTAKNFLHADLTANEFVEKQAERGETLIGFFLDSEKPASSPNALRLIYGLLASRPDHLKLSIIHTLGDGDDQVAALAGENVVIGDRNVRCLEVLARELSAGRKNVGIFYGAAHFPDMEKRLLEQGFIRTNHEWLTAWNVLKPIRKPVAPVPPLPGGEDKGSSQ
jgi:hypothetical protein